MALPLLCCPFATHRIYANTIAIVQAENSTIKGKVIDSQTGEPLTGAYITVNGTKKVAVTNLDGEFTIDAKPGDQLVVTSLGYEKMQVRATNNPTVSMLVTLGVVMLVSSLLPMLCVEPVRLLRFWVL